MLPVVTGAFPKFFLKSKQKVINSHVDFDLIFSTSTIFVDLGTLLQLTNFAEIMVFLLVRFKHLFRSLCFRL